jgi:hypothetical protein
MKDKGVKNETVNDAWRRHAALALAIEAQHRYGDDVGNMYVEEAQKKGGGSLERAVSSYLELSGRMRRRGRDNQRRSRER